MGHALAGVAAGCLTVGRVSAPRQLLPKGTPGTSLSLDRRLVVFAALGLLADIDFLFGVHSAYTHSVGATVVVGGLAASLSGQRRARVALASAAAYGTHVLLDWLGSDTVEPLGVMALWPVSTDYFLSDR